MNALDDRFERLAEVVADFGSPFYTEERQRDVWNEASALGFQTMLWGTLGLGCAMTWIGGRPVMGWAVALYVVATVAGWLTLGHAGRRGVTGREGVRLRQPRVYLALVLYLATMVGFVVRSGIDLTASTVAGAVVGVTLVTVPAAIVTVVRHRRSAEADDRAAEADDRPADR